MSDPPSEVKEEDRGTQARGTTETTDRRMQLHQKLADAVAAWRRYPPGAPVPADLLKEIDSLSRGLARLPGATLEIIEDVTLAQKLGLEGRSEWKEKAERIAALQKPDPNAAYELERSVREETEKARGSRRPLPPCVNPVGRKPQAVAGKPRWHDLSELIDELLASKQVTFTLQVLEVSWDTWTLTQTEVHMMWYLIDGGEHIERWTYREGFVIVPEVPPGEQRPSGLPPGKHQGTVLQYERAEPGSEEGMWILDRAEFERAHKRLTDIVRLFLEVIGTVSESFAAKYGDALKQHKKTISRFRYTKVDPSFPSLLGRAPLARPSDPQYSLFPRGATQVEKEASTLDQQVEGLPDPINKLRGTRVTLTFEPRIIHFENDSDSIDQAAVPEVQAAIDALRTFFGEYGSKLAIEVAGHADKTGERSYNGGLAIRRANRVAGLLDKRAKDILSHISPHGCGDQYAPSQNRDPNYRVAIVALDEDAFK